MSGQRMSGAISNARKIYDQYTTEEDQVHDRAALHVRHEVIGSGRHGGDRRAHLTRRNARGQRTLQLSAIPEHSAECALIGGEQGGSNGNRGGSAAARGAIFTCAAGRADMGAATKADEHATAAARTTARSIFTEMLDVVLFGEPTGRSACTISKDGEGNF